MEDKNTVELHKYFARLKGVDCTMTDYKIVAQEETEYNVYFLVRIFSEYEGDKFELITPLCYSKEYDRLEGVREWEQVR